ncbi:MAG TPA: hypothetical protein VI894_01350 [Candidatus Nanoarchaeia archaeon]|nr:hypothetical protein [Candidatus Nanoarchaeia archaeon]
MVELNPTGPKTPAQATPSSAPLSIITQAIKPSSQKKAIPQTAPETLEMSNKLNTLGRNIRVVEERYINIRKKSTIIEQNMINDYKKLFAQSKSLSSEFMELKKEINNINEKLFLLQKELQNCAKKEDTKLVEKYVMLWNPSSFLRKEEAEKMIKNFMEEKKVRG